MVAHLQRFCHCLADKLINSTIDVRRPRRRTFLVTDNSLRLIISRQQPYGGTLQLGTTTICLNLLFQSCNFVMHSLRNRRHRSSQVRRHRFHYCDRRCQHIGRHHRTREDTRRTTKINIDAEPRTQCVACRKHQGEPRKHVLATKNKTRLCPTSTRLTPTIIM